MRNLTVDEVEVIGGGQALLGILGGLSAGILTDLGVNALLGNPQPSSSELALSGLAGVGSVLLGPEAIGVATLLSPLTTLSGDTLPGLGGLATLPPTPGGIPVNTQPLPGLF